MADFLAAKITSQGQLMIMQDLNNEIDLQFTRIAYGNGIYNADEEYPSLSARTALKSQKQAFNINYKMIKGGTSLELGVVANNATLNEGYSMTEVGLFAKDGSDENATEKLYAIAIAKNGCADYMPAYNGSSTVRILQKFQVDVSNASSVTIEFVDGSVVAQSYLEEFYYNKSAVDSLLGGKMNYAVLESISTLTALNEIATDTDYADGKYTLLIPIATGNIIANLDIGISETAIMSFHGDYVFLHFPYNNKTFRYSDSATYKWARVYADVDPADPVVAAMIAATKTNIQHAHLNSSLSASATTRGYICDNQSDVGRLYISGTDFIEYVDLESTENAEVLETIRTDHGTGAEVTWLSEPSDTYYIQTWHKAEGEIVQRFKVGTSGTYSAWVSTTPAVT